MLDALIRTHRDPTEFDFDELWREGLFVFDSNVLLDLYRLPASASSDLIGIFKDKKLQPRIWIGFQVIVEFLNNRHETIGDQKNKFNTVRSLLNAASVEYDSVFETLMSELAKLKLKQRHSLIDPDRFLTPEKTSEGRRVIEEFLAELEVLEGKQSDVNDRDQIKEVVLEVFHDRIGHGFSQHELDEIYRLGAERYESEVPPGYKDKGKKGAYTVGNRQLIRKYGDLVLWKEIISKAKLDDIRNVVLVTGDVKEDWWLEKRGKKLGPRRELLNEIFRDAECVQNFYMYDTASFLKHAKSHLKASVQDSSISQAKDLIEKNRQSRLVSEDGYVLLADLIRSTAANFSRIKVGIGNSVIELPPVKIAERDFYRCLVEIYDNAITHGANNYVGVQAKDQGDSVALRFKNVCSAASKDLPIDEVLASSASRRGRGLLGVQEVMSSNGVTTTSARDGKRYVVELSIPKSKFSDS